MRIRYTYTVEAQVEQLASALVRRARRSAGLTQAELARRSGVPRPVVWAIEHERRQPSLPTLAKVLAGAGMELRVDIGQSAPAADPKVDRDLAEERAHAVRVRDALELADSIKRSKQLEAAQASESAKCR